MARSEPLGERVARLEERLKSKLPEIEEKLGQTADSLNHFSKELHGLRAQLVRLCQYGRIALMLASSAVIYLAGPDVALRLAGYGLKLVSALWSVAIR